MHDFSTGMATEGLTLVDSMTRLRPAIDFLHASIHAGRVFTVSNKFNDVPSTQVAGIELTVPAGSIIHLEAIALSCTAGPVIANILKNYQFQAEQNPSAAPSYNRNMESSRVATMTVATKVNGTIETIEGYASKDMLVIPAATAGGAVQLLADDEELLLTPGKYMITLTNSSGGVLAFLGYSLLWHE